MPETLITELLKEGTIVAVFGWIAYTLWKRYDKANNELKEEVKELRSRYENELLSDSLELKILVNESVHEKKELTKTLTEVKTFIEVIQRGYENVQKNYQSTLNRGSNVMECLTKEIQIVKPILESIQKNLK